MIDTAALLAELVAIPSVNPSLVPGAEGEPRIAEFVAGWLREAGAEVAVEEAAPKRPNVVASVRGTGGGRSLMLNAHLDTVGVGGMTDPFTPRVENGRLYGRGAYDMKGSLAAAMAALAELAVRPAAGNVMLTAVCDEEFASIGTAAVLRSHRADAAVVTEPTGLNICVAHKGFIWFEIESRGVAAHGSRPDLGRDAIAALGPVLAGLGRLNDALRSGRTHPLLGAGSIHASLISGGRELSTYPDLCRLSLERRTVPGETTRDAEAQVRELLGENMAVETTLVRDAFEVSLDEQVVRALRTLRPEARIYGETPWFDSALVQAAGIPPVVFGPGGGGAHADVEWSELGQVRECAEVLVALARSFCG